jgi:chloride channel 7
LNDANEYYRFTCPEGDYNAQATLFFNTEGGVIRALMNQEINTRWIALFIFTLTWYIFMVFTAGTFIPGGLFVPGMIIGCAIGALVKDLRTYLLSNDNPFIG